MFTANQVSCRIGDNLLFEHASFTINDGDRVGVIGPNGVGKSTLLRIIAGELAPTSGSVWLQSGAITGYLRQGFADVPDGTLGDLLDIPTNGLLSAQHELERAGDALADTDDVDAAMERLDDAQAAFDAAGGYVALSELSALLASFGLDGIELSRPLTSLSGGQKTRAGLAGLLASGPDLLVLDEPTNHLDMDAQAWLRSFLAGYRGAVVLVSHDRGFLDNVVTGILAIDPQHHAVTAYAGTYSDYVGQRRHEEQEAIDAWHRQQEKVERVKRDIRAAETKARSIEHSTVNFAVRKKAAKIARPAVVRKAKLERMLEGDAAADKPDRRWTMSLDFAESERAGTDIAILSDVDIRRGDRTVLHDVNLHVRHGDRIALIGPNGSGKTSLLKVISGELAPANGSVRIGAGVVPGYFAQEQESLDPDRTVLEHARALAAMSESDARTFLHKFLFVGDMALRAVGSLSYGERARLMLALLVLRGTTLLMLDEPLNHLDIDSREEFEEALEQYTGTVLLVVHDAYAIQRLTNRAFSVDRGHVTEIDPATIVGVS